MTDNPSPEPPQCEYTYGPNDSRCVKEAGHAPPHVLNDIPSPEPPNNETKYDKETTRRLAALDLKQPAPDFVAELRAIARGNSKPGGLGPAGVIGRAADELAVLHTKYTKVLRWRDYARRVRRQREQLRAENERLKAERDTVGSMKWANKVVGLEARLAKAVEALEYYAAYDRGECSADGIAEKTLAEIREGGETE